MFKFWKWIYLPRASPCDQILSITGQVEETPDSMQFYTFLPNEPLTKERVEAFSDGVYAIVATLLILDIWFVSLCYLECSQKRQIHIFYTQYILLLKNLDMFILSGSFLSVRTTSQTQLS